MRSARSRRTVRRGPGRTFKNTVTILDLGNLVEVELHRGLPTEDRHQYLQLLLVRIDLADRGRQRREGTVRNGDRVADLEVQHLDLGLGFGLLGRRGRSQPLED